LSSRIGSSSCPSKFGIVNRHLLVEGYNDLHNYVSRIVRRRRFAALAVVADCASFIQNSKSACRIIIGIIIMFQRAAGRFTSIGNPNGNNDDGGDTALMLKKGM
jgi:hypothetical protein